MSDGIHRFLKSRSESLTDVGSVIVCLNLQYKAAGRTAVFDSTTFF